MKTFHLFIGGPLHAKWQEVEAVPAVDPSAFAAITSGGQPTPPAECDDSYPEGIVSFEHATTYRKRTVNHIDADTGDTYMVRVYVWEGIEGAQEATLHLGDAVAHRWFLEHGTVIASDPTAAHHRLIIPGR